MRYKAAVLGLGVVGRAQVRMLTRRGYGVVGYDPEYMDAYPEEYINACDFAIICVGTPSRTSGRVHTGYVHDALDRLPSDMPIMIRSTVPPAELRAIRFNRKGWVVHVPEFMHERPGGAWDESWKVPFMVLGGSEEAREFFRPHLRALTDAPITETDIASASLGMYAANSFWALKVAFTNLLAEIADAYDIPYEEVRKVWTANPQVGGTYTFMNGFKPGFGGACLPKDLLGLAHIADDVDVDAELLLGVSERNPSG